jgi:hypothetical protein
MIRFDGEWVNVLTTHAARELRKRGAEPVRISEMNGPGKLALCLDIKKSDFDEQLLRLDHVQRWVMEPGKRARREMVPMFGPFFIVAHVDVRANRIFV